jgi:hypothetical protein
VSESLEGVRAFHGLLGKKLLIFVVDVLHVSDVGGVEVGARNAL